MHLKRHLTLIWITLTIAASAVAEAEGDPAPVMEPFVRKTPSVLTAPVAPTPLPQISVGSKRLRTERSYVGLELGVTTSMHFGGDNYAIAGSYPDGMRNAELSQYSPDVSYMGHAVLDLSLSNSIGIITKVGYRMHSAVAKGVSPAGNISGADPRLENNIIFTLDYVALDALLRVQLMKQGLYALGGVGYGSLTKNFVYGNQTSEGIEHSFTGELANFYNDKRIDAKVGIGTWLPLGDGGLMIAPELLFAIPLMPLHSHATTDTYAAIDRQVNTMAYATLGFAIKFPISGGESGTQQSSTLADRVPGDQRSTIERKETILSGRVVNNAGEPINDATLTVVDLHSNEVVATDKTDNGNYSIRVDAPGRYSVSAEAPGYLFGSSLFEVDQTGRALRRSEDIRLSPSTDGRVRLLVFFDFDKATLQSSSYPELDRAVAMMKSNQAIEVEIAGFTDAQGSDAYNKELSQRRANAVSDYIIGKGVSKDRLTAIGYGEGSPVASNDTEDGRAENRRVEFVVRRR